jgi:hypothetical protein
VRFDLGASLARAGELLVRDGQEYQATANRIQQTRIQTQQEFEISGRRETPHQSPLCDDAVRGDRIDTQRPTDCPLTGMVQVDEPAIANRRVGGIRPTDPKVSSHQGRPSDEFESPLATPQVTTMRVHREDIGTQRERVECPDEPNGGEDPDSDLILHAALVVGLDRDRHCHSKKIRNGRDHQALALESMGCVTHHDRSPKPETDK